VGPRGALGSLLSSRDDIWVQDPASSRAVELAKGLKPRLIIDLCAGQGTKTRQLAATFPDAQIIACDPDERRSGILAQAFERHRRVRPATPDDVHRAQRGKADLVVLDVPCSNSGVLARRPEAKYRLTGKYLSQLVKLQQDILTQGRALLAPGGAMLYSTCSVEPVENDDQIAWACKTLGLSASGPGVLLPGGGPGRPDREYHDGAFSALLTS
jgi:16S rRNA (cytosine967-C5)-methyltransferase